MCRKLCGLIGGKLFLVIKRFSHVLKLWNTIPLGEDPVIVSIFRAFPFVAKFKAAFVLL
jgi:hypothetical protein